MALQKFFASSLIFLLAFAPLVFAEDYSSTNFLVRNPAANSFGGEGTSTNFEAVMSGNDVAQTEATSSSFILNSGHLFFEAFTPESKSWRWYDDEENETPTTPLAGENISPLNVPTGGIIKLRVTVAEQANIGGNDVKFRLQFATSSGFTSGGIYVTESGSCNGSSVWCYADGVDSDDDVISTALLSDADSCTGSVGDGCGRHNESGISGSTFDHIASTTAEYEFTIQESGSSGNTVYFFRLYDMSSSSTVPYASGSAFPSISTSGATLTFSIDGIPAATSTEGVTTDVTTTATAVPFGTMLINTPVEAAHRLTVTTNAGQGYKIFALQRQGFLGPNAEIAPVTATNESPTSWSTGCPGGAAGCFGYHSGEDVLAGGSTRFAANDTFAPFSSTPKEVAYNPSPATDKTTDIVYKVEARNLQAAGMYESSVVYIVTPVF